jgi:serine/threonine protein kinase
MPDPHPSDNPATLNLRPQPSAPGFLLQLSGPDDSRTLVHDSPPKSPPPVAPPDSKMGYEILGELGRGGMGVVYKARDRRLGRIVALKMVLSAHFACAEDLLRFRLEGETAARLQHPNIVQVYEVGSCLDRPFLALEFVEGGTLARSLGDSRPTVQQAAALIEVLARAVQVAHNHGIVHRDLKPANVLLSFPHPPSTPHPPGLFSV